MAVIAVLAVVLFGGRLPEVARTVGGYYQQFRKSLADIQDSIKNDLDIRKDLDLNEPPRLEDHSDFDDDEPAPTFEPPVNDDSDVSN